MNSRQAFSRNLKHLMDKRHVSRNMIADTLNVPYTTVTSWVIGKHYPRIAKIDQLAKLFNVSKSKLIEAPTNIDLFNILRYENVSWQGHPLDQDDYQMFKLWFKNKYGSY